jgi:hypothetical protein
LIRGLILTLLGQKNKRSKQAKRPDVIGLTWPPSTRNTALPESSGSLLGVDYHDKFWHFHIGWNVMAGESFDLAALHFKEALRLDGKAWIVMEGMSSSYAGTNDYAKAAVYLLMATEHSSKIPRFRYLWAHLFRERLEAFMSKVQRRAEPQQSLLHALDEMEDRGDRAVILCHLLHRDEDLRDLIGAGLQSGYDKSVLGRALRIEVQVLARSGETFTVVDYLQDIIDRLRPVLGSVEAATEALANLLDGSIEEWEEALPENEEQSFTPLEDDDEVVAPVRLWNKSQGSPAEHKIYADMLRAKLYFELAVAGSRPKAGSADEGVKTAAEEAAVSLAVSRLQELARASIDVAQECADSAMAVYTWQPLLKWTRWLRFRGEDPGAEFQQTIRKWVSALLLEVEQKADEDGIIGLDTWRKLDWVVSHAGGALDTRMSLYAVLGSMAPHLGKDEQSEEEENEALDRQWGLSVEEEWIWYCDGCLDEIPAVTELFECAICLDANWCGNCRRQLEDGTRVAPVCSAAHPMLKMWPERLRLVKDHVLCGSEYTWIRKHWWNRLKERWAGE